MGGGRECLSTTLCGRCTPPLTPGAITHPRFWIRPEQNNMVPYFSSRSPIPISSPVPGVSWLLPCTVPERGEEPHSRAGVGLWRGEGFAQNSLSRGRGDTPASSPPSVHRCPLWPAPIATLMRPATTTRQTARVSDAVFATPNQSRSPENTGSMNLSWERGQR